MPNFLRASIMSAALLVAACSQPAETPLDGDWALQGDESRIAFTSVKAGTITEPHSFKSLGGSVSGEGAAQISIDLASVETDIDIRNERMGEHLFETGIFPEAIVSAQIDPAALASLAIGESVVQSVAATLDLHGVESVIETELNVTRIGADRVKVESISPIIVDADAFALGEGLEKLQELASLPGITPQVPVTFSFVFARHGADLPE